jgi:hypothetical protein
MKIMLENDRYAAENENGKCRSFRWLKKMDF